MAALGQAPSEQTPLLNPDQLDTSYHTASDERADFSTAASSDNTGAVSPEDVEGSDPAKKRFTGIPELRAKLKFIFPALSIGVFLSACDQTIIAASYGIIGSDLHGLDRISWLVTAYLVAATAVQPLYGKLSDIFGRKQMLLISYTMFSLGSVFCGLAQTMTQLIAGRAFAGIGAGGMNILVSTILTDILPLEERGVWQGYVNIVFATGASIGAPMGGLFADSIGWRWAFLFQGPLCALAIACVALIFNPPARQSDSWQNKVRRIDFQGAFILVVTLVNLLMCLDNLAKSSWKSPLVIFQLTIVVTHIPLFVYVESQAKEPFAPVRLIFGRDLIGQYMCIFFGVAASYGVMFYLPLFYQLVHHATSAAAGLMLVPAVVAAVVGSLAWGVAMKRTGRIFWLVVSAYVCLAAGCAMLLLSATFLPDSTASLAVSLAVGGLGNGSGITSTLIAVIANSTPEDQATVTACSYLARSLGTTVGLSLSSMVVQKTVQESLVRRLAGFPGLDVDTIVRKVTESLDHLDKLAPAVRVAVVEGYASALRVAFGILVGYAALALMSTSLVREKQKR